jgi:UTP:GlnB (protein PII) uridylyltransferase
VTGNGNGNGTRTGRVALGTVATIVATGLLAWNAWQDHMAEQVTEARNQQQQRICESVNAVNDTLEIIIREALVPEPGDSPEEIARDQRLKQLALAEIERARCRVAPLPTRGMGPG